MLFLALALVAHSPAAAAPNMWGHTGLVHTQSARAPGHWLLDVSASGFLLAAPDYLAPGPGDLNALLGGHLTGSLALFDLLELSLASRSASNANSARGPSAFSLGDLYPSLKVGLTFLPVAVGLDVRARLPTRVNAVGFDVASAGITTQGLVTLDLHEQADIPVRVHLNGGYVFENGKYRVGPGAFFEDNANFYDGVDGALLALASDSWFYDQIVGGLGIEVPLPFVTPFVEAFYRAAVAVPAKRGAGGAAYDLSSDGHLTLTPGARLTPWDGFTIDLGVDIGVLGTAGGGTDDTLLVSGTPPNPPFLLRVGVTSTFDPFLPKESALAHVDDVPPVSGEDDGATQVSAGGGAAVSTGQTSGARVVGYVTNNEDETLEGALQVWDSAGSREAGTSTAGAFEIPVQAGDVAVVARMDGYFADGVTLHVAAGARARAGIVLKKLPKLRRAVLEQGRIAVQTKVPFEFKKPRLQSTAEYVLADVVDVLLRNPALRLRVDVYAEPLSSPEESQRLADERAAAVLEHLVQHGVWRARIEAKGTPLPASEADKGRRVDFLIVP